MRRRESAAAKAQRDAENLQNHLYQRVMEKASTMAAEAKDKLDGKKKKKVQDLQKKFDLMTANYECLLVSLALYSCLLTVLQFMGSERCRSDFINFFTGLWTLISGFASLTWQIADAGGAWWILPILIDVAVAVCVYFGLRKVVYIYHDYVLMHAETIVGFYTADESDTAVHEAEIHAAIVALVPIALLTWLCTYLPKGFNAFVLYVVVEVVYMVIAYSKNKEHVYKK